ncbi:MAG: methyl-accepting chemotaxis protein [Spirochaetaceae bacterium]
MQSTAQQPLVEVLEDKCVNCHRCIAVCPVKMCNDGSGDYVKVNHDRCIGCGQCIDACTHDARVALDDSASFFEDLKDGVPMVAVVAPAAAAEFPDQYLELNTWLKSLGIAAVFDVSFGAELTVKSYLNYIETTEPRMVISQPCPTLVTFVEIYRPELIPFLAPADSPMAHTLKMIRRFYPTYADHRLAVVSPCLSKRREFNDIGIGDYNVTIKAIAKHLRDAGVELGRFSKTDFESPPAERAVLFSSPGGLMRTVERYLPDASKVTRKIEGQPEIYHYLAHMPAALTSEGTTLPLLVDCLNCEMGCNGGPGTSNREKHVDVVESAVERRAAEARKSHAPKGEPSSKRGKARYARKIDKQLEDYWSAELYHREYRDRSAAFRENWREPTEAELQEVYHRTHKHNPEDFLNCTACGYKSCEQMAVAIVNGLNRPENCRHYMETELKRYIQGKEETAQELQEIAERSTEHLQRNLTDTEALTEKTQHMSSAVEESSAAVEQMVAQIQSVTTVLHTNAESVESLQKASEEGRSALQEVAATIEKVASNSEALLEASGVIQTIAAQTNLLSMNASIEAAHAGDAGRGFAVVAEEIRKLAEGSAEQARSIAQVLSGIKKSIETVEVSSADTLRRFEKVAELTTTVREQEMVIKNAVDEQSAGGKQVLQALQEMTELTEGVESSTQSILESSRSVLSRLEHLSQVQAEEQTAESL